jgi:subtilase family serine protease
VGLLGTGLNDRPDLIVASARRRGTNLVVTVTNIGPADSPPSSTLATFTTADTRVTTIRKSMADLAPDQSVEITFAVPDRCLSAPCDVVVTADAAGDVRERHENNNDLTKSL